MNLALPRGVLPLYYPALQAVVVVLYDAVALLALFGILHYQYGEIPIPYRMIMAVFAVAIPLIYQWTGVVINFRARKLMKDIQRLVFSMLMVFLLAIATASILEALNLESLRILTIWATLTLLAQLAVQLALRYFVHFARRHAFNIRHAVVIGGGTPCRDLMAHFERNTWLGIKIVGCVEVRHHWTTTHLQWLKREDTERREILERLHRIDGKYVVVESYSQLETAIREWEVDEAYIALPVQDSLHIRPITEHLLRTDVDLSWVPDMSALHLMSHSVDHFEGLPIFRLTQSPLSSGQETLKRVEDLILGTMLSVLVLPLMLAIAVAVRVTSPGPIFFVQRRHGLHNKCINVWKFRTMYVADPNSKETQATRNDQRITPIGRFLRRWSLDELPQIFQVPVGTLSLIGPRPHPLWLNDRFSGIIQGYMDRHRVRPGLTGWAQVNGLRGETDTAEKMKERVRYDLYYINNWSLTLDIKILMMTISAVITGINAY